MIRLSAPIIGSDVLMAIERVLASGQLSAGAEVERFQEEFSFVAAPRTRALAVNSGTAALHVALLAAGIGRGDEVILPAFTFAGTANAVVATGAKAVFADVERHSGLIDLAHAESLITRHTAAIVPVHLYGNPADMRSCMRLADRHSLFVLEDAAQAHLAQIGDQHVGTFGHAAAFSFYATKNMTTGEGGMITTRDGELAERCRILLNQGQVRRYEHTLPGWNYRMTNIAAAIGLAQLPHLTEWTRIRQENAAYYRARLPVQITLPPEGEASHVYHQFTLSIDGQLRDELRAFLEQHDIQSDVYYPRPLHRQPAFFSTEQLPSSELLSETVLSIPVHPSLSAAELTHTANCVILFLESRSWTP